MIGANLLRGLAFVEASRRIADCILVASVRSEALERVEGFNF